MQHKYHFKHLDHHYEVTGEYRQLPAHLDGKFLVKILPPVGVTRQAVPAVAGSDSEPGEKTFVANNEHHLVQQLGRAYPGLSGFKGV
ncbi:hypothetical protein [Polaromonas sp. SM01]|uniref:hypothetical protein n=1 Tax=Polaromonas sp. SM01 TaxID=3085630 RepID=UPI0029823EBF|nr:hypothetical protein [Polaromonas sp. SM01]MDW5444741.1 hypothetical protein [Polaromonas sp. SM01]